MDAELLYQKDLKILAEHVTSTRGLRSSVLLRFLQEASIAHTEALGIGRAKTLDRGFLWVILNQHIEVQQMPVYDDLITVQSWPGKMEHILFPRHYRILNRKTGETMVLGTANWMLIDAQTRRMVFPEKEGIFVPGTQGDEEVEIPPHISMPELNQSASRTATFSLSDINGHLNNTSYLDLCEDLIPLPWLTAHTLRTADIAYREEIPLGESFDILYGQEEQTWYFKTSKPEKFSIKLSYE